MKIELDEIEICAVRAALQLGMQDLEFSSKAFTDDGLNLTRMMRMLDKKLDLELQMLRLKSTQGGGQ